MKNAPDKTYYLGSSVKAVSGRWQEGKDVFWYTKSKEGSGSDIQDEIRAVKEREEALMRQALGLHPDEGKKESTRKESKKREKSSLSASHLKKKKKKKKMDKEKKKEKKERRV